MSEKRRRWRGGLGAALVAGLACAHGDPPADPKEKVAPRAILLVSIDGVVPSEISTYGGPKVAKRLAALASEGRAYSQVWTAAPETRPAAAGLMTGRGPDRSGVIDDLTIPLPADQPTIATALSAAGYTTAAFPASSFLGTPSGLLRGFQVVDEPPAIPFGPAARVPQAIDAAAKAKSFETWLHSVPAGARWFAWIHLADPWRAAFDRGKADQVVGVDAVDAAVGTVLDAIQARGDRERSLVIVVGTFADVSGGSDEPPGPGFSLAERAIRVPLIVRAPGRSFPVAVDAPLTTLDVPATIAAAAEVALPQIEGLDILAAQPGARTLFSQAFATWDQAGWQVLRAVRRGEGKWVEGAPWGGYRVTGWQERRAPANDPAVAAAKAELQTRPAAAPATIPFEAAKRCLEKEKVRGLAALEMGRAFAPEPNRRAAIANLWEARTAIARDAPAEAIKAYDKALTADNADLAALVERGIVSYRTGAKDARDVLSRAAATYPWSPTTIHWFGHAVEADRRRAEPFWLLAYAARPGDADLAYDLACTRSVAGDVDGSFAYLKSAIAAGFTRWETMQADPDLRALRATEKFASLMREHAR